MEYFHDGLAYQQALYLGKLREMLSIWVSHEMIGAGVIFPNSLAAHYILS